MKKVIAFLVIVCVVAACSTMQTVYYQTDNYNRLNIGMSKWEVEDWIGPPLRYLDARRTAYGYEEILLYRNRYNEYFALEFVNDYLVSADYVYDGGWYPMYPSYNRPSFGKPVFPPHYRPNRPYYPPSDTYPARPSQPDNPQRPDSRPRPPSTTRPDNNSQAPNYERSSSTTRPSANERPASNTARPSSNSERPASTTRPSTGTSNSDSRESTRPSSTERSPDQNTGTTSTRGTNTRGN
ncbi:MAG: hypothetical protein LBH19_05475 [Dysgonamonadaceae bacterium]|jgi:hypothetical protein|nr:hypothetical protein [Dysgonamonadaceae bacterium]